MDNNNNNNNNNNKIKKKSESDIRIGKAVPGKCFLFNGSANRLHRRRFNNNSSNTRGRTSR